MFTFADFGLEFMQGAWLIVAIILGIIGFVIIGFFYDSDEGPLVILEVLLVAIVTIFWPIMLSIALCVGVISLPIILGKVMRTHVEVSKEKKKRKLEEMNEVDRFKSEKL